MSDGSANARDRILARLRAAGGSGPAAPAQIPVRRFDWSPSERLARFRARMEAVRGEIIAVGDDWPSVVASLLRAKGAQNLAYGPDGPHGAVLEAGWPQREGVALLPWSQPVEDARDALFGAVDVAFTSCVGGVAETGSLVLWPTPEEPRLLSLVPPIHLVLLDAARIRSTFHEVVVEERWGVGMPTNALLISGPSKSADIEQTLAYGVHGPRALIVLMRGVNGLSSPSPCSS